MLKQLWRPGYMIAAGLAVILAISLERNGIYPLSVTAMVFAWTAVVVGITCFSLRKKRFAMVPLWVRITLLGFLVMTWLSLIFSTTKTVGFTEVLLVTALVFLILTLPSWWRWLNRRWALAGLLLFGVINSLVALGQYFYRSETRIAGFFLQPEIVAHYYPNAFALSCLLVLPLAFYFLQLKSIFWQVWGVAGSVIIGSSLVLSWSRGGWLGGIGILILVIGLHLVRKRWRDLVKLVLVLVGIGVVVWGAQTTRMNLGLPMNTFIDKAQFAGTEAQTSVGERRDFILGGLVLSGDKPLLGFGPGSFPYIYPQQQETWLANAPHQHNWFVKVAMERGWLALVFLVVFWLWLVYVYVSNWRDYSESAHFAMIAILVAVGHNLVDFNLNFVFNYLVLVILVSLVLAERLIAVKNRVKSERIFLGILLFVMLVLTWLEAPLIYKIKKTDLQIEPNLYVNEYYLQQAYQAEQNNDYQQAIVNVQQHLDLNPHDAIVWNRLGDYYWRQRQFESALAAYEEALINDPKNNWSYYYNKLNALRVLSRWSDLREFLPVILAELEQYTPLAVANIHYTAQSPNLQNAILAAEMSQRYAQESQLRQRLRELQELLFSAANKFGTE